MAILESLNKTINDNINTLIPEIRDEGSIERKETIIYLNNDSRNGDTI